MGRVPYARAYALQEHLAAARRAGAVGDSAILCEHDPVVTCGRRTRPEDVARAPCPVVWIDRGGEATYHGPGQVVGYPILRLSGVGAVGRYLRGLEETLIEVLSDFDLPAKRGAQTGVWVHGRKVVSIGIAVRRGVTMHGFALNVNTDLFPFRAIRPCGLDPQVISSMREILGRTVDAAAVKERVWERLRAWHARRAAEAPHPAASV